MTGKSGSGRHRQGTFGGCAALGPNVIITSLSQWARAGLGAQAAARCLAEAVILRHGRPPLVRQPRGTRVSIFLVMHRTAHSSNRDISYEDNPFRVARGRHRIGAGSGFSVSCIPRNVPGFALFVRRLVLRSLLPFL